jgi:hypothetical protein
MFESFSHKPDVAFFLFFELSFFIKEAKRNVVLLQFQKGPSGA